MDTSDRSYGPLWLAWLMWGLVATLYCIGFFQRMAPAVIADDLMRDFSLDGVMLGNLSAMYFYAYAAMQIPTGLLVDQIGARRLASIACLIAALGILVFSFGSSLWLAYLGRFLVGASVAVAWVTCMKLAGHWFPANRFATVTGVALLLGNVGGIIAGVPLAVGVDLFGWRMMMGVSGFLTLVLAIITWLVLRDDPSEYGYRSHAPMVVQNHGSLPMGAALKSVVTRKDTWLLFFGGGLSTAPVLVFAGLWGVPYLTQVYHLETSQAALITSTMLMSLAVSGPINGAISDRLGRRKLPYLISTVLTTSFWAIFLLVKLPYIMLFPLLAAIGLTTGTMIIGFATAREVNHPGAAGAVGGVVNMSVLGIASVMQPLVGKILDSHWQGELIDGARVYSEAAYNAAFFWLVVCAAISIVMVACTKETYCRMSDV
ncbi:MAG: MFS transporter [Desulfofustis sp.]|nr:MFS transporter [Desulfofustis sp.]